MYYIASILIMSHIKNSGWYIYNYYYCVITPSWQLSSRLSIYNPVRRTSKFNMCKINKSVKWVLSKTKLGLVCITEQMFITKTIKPHRWNRSQLYHSSPRVTLLFVLSFTSDLCNKDILLLLWYNYNIVKKLLKKLCPYISFILTYSGLYKFTSEWLFIQSLNPFFHCVMITPVMYCMIYIYILEMI